MGDAKLSWPGWVLLGAIVLFSVSSFLTGDMIAARVRYHVVARDAVSGDVIVLDALYGRVRRLRVPVVAEDTVEHDH